MTHRIRTTMRPDMPLEVDDAEYADLAAQGLILAEPDAPGDQTADVPSPAPAVLDAAETLADDQASADGR